MINLTILITQIRYLPLSLGYLVASCGHGCCFFQIVFWMILMLSNIQILVQENSPSFWTTLALVFGNHVLPNDELWEMKNQPWNPPFCPYFMVGWFCFFWKKNLQETTVNMVPPIVWSPKGVGLIAHLMAPFRPALLAGSWSLGFFQMEKWIGSWGVIQNIWQPQNSGEPPKDLFSGGILDVHFI